MRNTRFAPFARGSGGLTFACRDTRHDPVMVVVGAPRGLEAVFELGFEHGMSENRSVSGAKTPEGPSPFKASRRRNGRFSPYPCRTRRIFPLKASKPACGAQLHGAVFSCSGGKSVSRRARNPVQRQPLGCCKDYIHFTKMTGKPMLNPLESI